MDGIKQIAAQIKAIWEKMGARARTASIAALVIVGIGLAVVIARPAGSYSLLYADLDPKDTSQMVGVLDSAKIPYELGAGGTVIKVPESDVDRARMLLAEQELPTGTAGWNVLDDTEWGAPTSVIETNRLRALQGELERTISALDVVNQARVHLALPKRAVFEDEKIPPTASVTVDLARGRELTPANAGAIQHLVAAGVPGLTSEEVTIVDTKGALLSRSGTDPAAAAALDYKRDLEQRLEKRVTRMLERTVGAGGAHATVSAEIDFSETETTEEIYDPEQTAVRSESIQEAIEGNAQARPGGLAGAIANGPGGEGGSMVPSKGQSSRTTKTKAYEVNRTVVHTTGPAAQLKRLTVSVMVDGSYAQPEDGTEAVFTPRTEEEIKELQKVVENAVGYNAARGDRISLVSVPFVDRPRIDGAMEPAEAGLPSWLPFAGGGGVLALVGLAFFLLRKKKPAVTPQVLQMPMRVSEAQRAVEAAESGNVAALGEQQAALPPADADIRELVVQTAEKDPERAAEVIKAWMRDAA